MTTATVTRAFPATEPLCVYCGRPAETVDHVIPRSRGGADDPSNIVPACGPCNRAKSDRTPEEWRAGQSRVTARQTAFLPADDPRRCVGCGRRGDHPVGTPLALAGGVARCSYCAVPRAETTKRSTPSARSHRAPSPGPGGGGTDRTQVTGAPHTLRPPRHTPRRPVAEVNGGTW